MELLARFELATSSLPIIFSLKQLAIKGDDLIALGIPRGKKLGDTLEALLDAVIDGRVENDKNKLIEYLKNHIA